MQKHKSYRERHPDRVKISSQICYQKYRDINLQKKRDRYATQKEIFKLDVKQCPICQIDYRRIYLKKHMVNRHKLSEDELPPDLCQHVIIQGGVCGPAHSNLTMPALPK